MNTLTLIFTQAHTKRTSNCTFHPRLNFTQCPYQAILVNAIYQVGAHIVPGWSYSDFRVCLSVCGSVTVWGARERVNGVTAGMYGSAYGWFITKEPLKHRNAKKPVAIYELANVRMVCPISELHDRDSQR